MDLNRLTEKIARSSAWRPGTCHAAQSSGGRRRARVGRFNGPTRGPGSCSAGSCGYRPERRGGRSRQRTRKNSTCAGDLKGIPSLIP